MAYKAKESGVMWQYYMDNHVDGKSTAWYDYVADASTEVDAVWRDWQVGLSHR